jgi:hypothetical protein
VAEQTVLLEAQDRVARGIAIEERRLRVVDGGVEPKHLAFLHEPCRRDDALRRQEVQAPELVNSLTRPATIQLTRLPYRQFLKWNLLESFASIEGLH